MALKAQQRFDGVGLCHGETNRKLMYLLSFITRQLNHGAKRVSQPRMATPDLVPNEICS